MASTSPRLLLLNPGPVTLTERVRAVLMEPDWCHRESEYAKLQREVQTKLERVYPQAAMTYQAIMLTGSGTAAVEAMVGSLVPRDGKALVVSNGVYGERMVAMLTAQSKAHEVIRFPWTSSFDPQAVDAFLEQHRDISHVIAVHHETTTGRLNPVAALGKICKTRNVALLLDTVSSFGGEPLQFEEWNLEACAATGNKCLHGVPGMAFVLVRSQVFSQRRSGATSVYLDLFQHQKTAAIGEPPFTPAVHVLRALNEALNELEDSGGWMARHQRYRALSQRVMKELGEMGVELFLESPDAASVILTAYRVPPQTSYQILHQRLKDAGFVIYAGQGQFQGTIFRISTMGALTDADIDRLLEVMRSVLVK